MKGKITHRIWTVLGEIEVLVSYEIVKLSGGKMGLGSLEISGSKKDGEKPKELDNKEVIEEIINACIEDMQSKENKEETKDVVNEILNKEFKTVLPDSNWGAN